MTKLDPKVLSALALQSDTTTIAPFGGSGFASTLKISTVLAEGKKKCFFMKTGDGKDAETMFQGEFESLNTIHNAVPSLCPKAFSHGAFESKPGYYLVTDFINLYRHSSSSGETLAHKMAKLHLAPQAEKYNNKFGFPVPTCCGSTVQDNTWEDDWAEFFGKRRLMHILAESEAKNGTDKVLREWVEKTVDTVVPRLLGVLENVKPALVHGDLWSGNASKGCFGENGENGDPEDVVFDPSACYAHNEYEFGIMKMFGGFGPKFFNEYHEHIPKAEPVKEYDDRAELYQLYHQLNHHALFGSGYKSGAISTMKRLYTKYGG
ncbi:uncharacterized protein LAJ45_06512 [Morchella importuna]|uniref:uncharacterized protein n=1 Tax=Morchella importuna TaxID=1174673 RepID=UPI001E8E24C0|nr:uncharacterized protein LAJ45_06512 [Morchella importuna]KAH8149433.1 hypothetical protein LAJ45_06512 [Morchella importuna]